MRRLAALLVILGLGVAFSTQISGDEKKDAPKAKGQLPPNWKKLGLSDDQVTKIYSIQSDYRAKIEPLQKQIVDLRKKQLSEMEGVLTTAQKARLREILSEKGPKDTEPSKDGKPVKGTEPKKEK